MVRLSGDLWRLDDASDEYKDLCGVMGRVCDMARCNVDDRGDLLPHGVYDVEVAGRESPSKIPHFHILDDKKGSRGRYNVRFFLDGRHWDVITTSKALRLSHLKDVVPQWLLEPTRDREMLRIGLVLNIQVLVWEWVHLTRDNRFTPALWWESYLMGRGSVDLSRFSGNVYDVGDGITVEEARSWYGLTDGLDDDKVFDFTGSMFPDLVS